jgi:phosphatidylglycerophosphatase A
MEQKPNETQTEKPTLDFFTRVIGSGFFTGYAPAASGTVGSALALAFFLIPNFASLYSIVPATIILFVIGGFAADKMEKIYGQDPSIVTVDEIVGMWLSMWFIPVTLLNILLAFVIFRILDILKPYPAGDIDKQTGGWNIMLDDVIAGLYTNVILQLSFRITLL